MTKLSAMIVSSVFMVSGCSLVSDKFNMDTGLDGCVEYTMVNFSAGPVRADKVMYHRVNDKCQNMPLHPQVGGNS